ncbi:MAG: hypothetical protein V2A79_19830 [Planctomycetota bacterium]
MPGSSELQRLRDELAALTRRVAELEQLVQQPAALTKPTTSATPKKKAPPTKP